MLLNITVIFEHVSSISGVICGKSFENNSNNEAKETKHEGMYKYHVNSKPLVLLAGPMNKLA